MNGTNSQNRGSEAELEGLWERYRQACGKPEGGPNFMPQLWGRIEARQSRFRAFERGARFFAAAAASSALILGGLVLFEGAQEARQWHAESYVEVLSADNGRASSTYLDPAPYEFEAAGRQDR